MAGPGTEPSPSSSDSVKATTPLNIYESEQLISLFCGKHIVLIGDSVLRGLYKDIVLLLQSDRLLRNDATELATKAIVWASRRSDTPLPP